MKTSILRTLLHYLMVGLFILTLMHINVVMDAQTVMTGEIEVGNRPYILKTPAIQPQQPMKTPKENNDSIKRRRHESPRNNVNSSKSTRQRRKNTWKRRTSPACTSLQRQNSVEGKLLSKSTAPSCSLHSMTIMSME